ncbi:unnamed protein product, partial [Chrysoparadoxa australica]
RRKLGRRWVPKKGWEQQHFCLPFRPATTSDAFAVAIPVPVPLDEFCFETWGGKGDLRASSTYHQPNPGAPITRGGLKTRQSASSRMSQAFHIGWSDDANQVTDELHQRDAEPPHLVMDAFARDTSRWANISRGHCGKEVHSPYSTQRSTERTTKRRRSSGSIAITTATVSEASNRLSRSRIGSRNDPKQLDGVRGGIRSPSNLKRRRLRSSTAPSCLEIDRQAKGNERSMLDSAAERRAKGTRLIQTAPVCDQQLGLAAGSRADLKPVPLTLAHSRPEVWRKRFQGNRKDKWATYLPMSFFFHDQAKLIPKKGSELDLSYFGVEDWQMANVAELMQHGLDWLHDTGGLESVLLRDCWRLTDDGMFILTSRFLGQPKSNRLQKLCLAGCAQLTDTAARHIHTALHHLRELDISSTAIADEGIKLLLSSGKSLRSFVARQVQGLTDTGLAGILSTIKHQKTLKHLDLERSFRFSNDGMVALLSEAGVLQRLSLKGCHQLSELSLMGMERARFTTMHMKVLDLSHMNIIDIGMQYVGQGCKQLQELRLSGCHNLTDLALQYLAKAPSALPLKLLDISQSKSFTGYGLRALVPTIGATLQKICLNGSSAIGSDGIKCLGRHCKNLEVIGLVELTLVSDAALDELGKGCPLLKKFDASNVIDQLEVTRRSRVPCITGKGIKGLCRGLRDLEVLKLNGGGKVGDDALIAVAASCQNLRVLYLRYCYGVSDNGVIAVVKHCPQLNQLVLGGCLRLTDSSIVAVAKYLGSGLRLIDLMGCRKLTDKSALALAATCCNLETLVVSGCEWFSAQAMVQLLGSCPGLTCLRANGVTDLAEDALYQLETTCRKLVYADFSDCPMISAARVQLAADRLPYVLRVPGKRVLKAASKSCQVFNEFHEVKCLAAADAAISIQSFARGVRGRLKARHVKADSNLKYMAIQTCLRHFWARRLACQELERRRAYLIAQRICKKWAKACIWRMRAKRQLMELRRERAAAVALQTAWRGKSGRAMALWRKKQLARIVMNWTILQCRMVRKVRAVSLWYKATTLLMCIEKLKTTARMAKQSLAIRKIQRLAKGHIVRSYARKARAAIAAERDNACRAIQCRWRASYRWRWQLRNVKLAEQEQVRGQFVREYAQIRIVDWWRLVNKTSLKRALLRDSRRRRVSLGFAMPYLAALLLHAAVVLQRSYRSMRARTLLKRIKSRKAKARCSWRRFYIRLRDAPKPEDAVRLQRIMRRYIRRRRRAIAATNIQRVVRGRQARQLAERLLARMFTRNAISLQRVVRGYLARVKVYQPLVRLNAAARVITRAVRKQIVQVRFKKILREAGVRKANIEKTRREAKIRKLEQETILKILNKGKEKCVIKIQRKWREVQVKRHEHEAEKLAMELAAREVKARKNRIAEIERRRKEANKVQPRAGTRLARGAAGIGKKLAHLTGDKGPIVDDYLTLEGDEEGEQKPKEKKAVRFFTKDKEEEAKKVEEEEEVLANSILNFQSASLVQEGVCGLHFTYGKKEIRVFTETQKYNKRTGRPYFTMISASLGVEKAVPVHLWYRMGKGEGVFTNVKADRAPDSHTNAVAQKVRLQMANENGAVIIGHDKLQLEFYCNMRRQDIGSAPAVDAIEVCMNDKELEEDLKGKEFEKLDQRLHKLGLAKGSIWIHRKTFKKRPKQLAVSQHHLKRHAWFTDRTGLNLEKYSLHDKDIDALHEV